MWARFLTGVVAAGVILAAVALWRFKPLRRARWIIAAITSYGAIAFVHVAITGISLRDALSGHGFLQFLPRVLQGAFIGGFVVLPLGWVVSLIRVGSRRREGSPAPLISQAIALTTCVALLFTSLPQRTPVRTPEQRIAELDRSLRALEDGERAMPRDTWDPDYVLRMVGRDPQRLFRWVHQNTYWIPYHGVLRGPVGVLMDRQGNSLDRAVLLATLLEKAEQTVRLAHGQVPTERAKKLLPALIADRDIAFAADRPERDTGKNSDFRLVSGDYGLDITSVQQTLSSAQQEVADLYAKLHSRVKSQSERLLRIVNRPKPGAEWSQRYDSAVGALCDHWWVQLQAGDKWIDFDLLQEPHTAGALAEMESSTSVAELPADLRHQITVRVVSEQESRTKLTEHAMLGFTLTPSELLGQPVVLQFWPDDWVSNSGQMRVRAELRRAALAQQTWGVALVVGGKKVAAGILLANGDDPKGRPQASTFDGIAAAFASQMGLNQQDPDRQLSAVWIEYEIRVPGEKPRIVRRSVFDLVGTAARASGTAPVRLDESKRLDRSLALMMRTEIFPVTCRFSPEFLAHLAAHSLIANHELINSVVRGDLAPGTPDSDALLDRMAPMVSPLYSLATARFEWGSDPASMFVDRPQLLTSHSYAAPIGPKGEQIALRDATDIVANDFGVSLTVHDGFAARLTQGVLDTNAEAILPLRVETLGNTAEAYEKSGAWVRVPDAHAAATLRLPPNSNRSIADEVSFGYEVIAPRAVIPMSTEEFAGWWHIDRASGNTLGMGSNGWGQAAVAILVFQGGEDAALNVRAAQQEPMWVRFFNGAREGFLSGYSFCVLVSGYEQVREDEVLIHERVSARITSSQAECFKQGLYGAAIGGIVSAVLPLFIATLGPLLSKWLTRISPIAGPRIVRAAAKAGGFFSGEGPPLLGNGGAAKPTPTPVPKTPKSEPTPPNEPTPAPPDEPPPPPSPPDPCPEGGSAGEPSGAPAGEPSGAPEPMYPPSPDNPYSPSDYQKYVDHSKYEFANAQSELASARQNTQNAQAVYEPLKAKFDAADSNFTNLKAQGADEATLNKAHQEYVDASRAKRAAWEDLQNAQNAEAKAQRNYNVEKKRADVATDPANQKANADDWQAKQDLQKAQQAFDDWQKANPGKVGTPEYEAQWDQYYAAVKRARDASLNAYRQRMFGDACGPSDGTDPTQAQPDPDLSNTQPAIDPTGKTEPGSDPLSKTQPGTPPTQRSPQGSGSSGSSPADEPIPPTEPAPQTRPGPPDSSRSTQRSPQSPRPPLSPTQKTLVGLGGAMNALGGGPK